MVLLTLADAFTEKFGSDSLAEIQRNIRGYLDDHGLSLMAPIVVIVGAPGAGKSSVGKRVALWAFGAVRRQ